MELIKAEDAPKIGVPDIDAQHAALIDLVNRLHQAMSQGEDRNTLEGIIAELIEQTQAHFAYEEQLMQQTGYPQYQSHKAAHEKLLQHITALGAQFRNGDLLLSFAVMMDLKAWATIHIEKSDQPLGVYLSEKGYHAE